MSLENERIVYNASKALNNVCYVKSTGIVDPDPSWSALREDSKDVVIFYIVDGKARLTVTGGDYPLYRGDCVIFPPRKYSKIKSDSKNPPTVYWLRCGKRRARYADFDDTQTVCHGQKFSQHFSCRQKQNGTFGQ